MSEVNEDPGWGGQWTEEKLQILRDYLEAYLTALKKQRRYFKLEYIDAFAGAGYRKEKEPNSDTHHNPSLFDDDAPISSDEAERYRDGSARIALDLSPGFDTYVFVEQDRNKHAELRDLAASHPDKEVQIYLGKAQDTLVNIAAGDWRNRRGVVFLDPYGMQVEWDLLTALAATEALDVWLLVPIGIGVNRMLPKRLAAMPAGWPEKHDRFFGTTEWRRAFYEQRVQPSLFGGADSAYERAAHMDDVARFYIERLRLVFPHVSSNHRVLTNSNGQPLYILCFAASNPNGGAGGLALRIAGHLLRNSP